MTDISTAWDGIHYAKNPYETLSLYQANWYRYKSIGVPHSAKREKVCRIQPCVKRSAASKWA